LGYDPAMSEPTAQVDDAREPEDPNDVENAWATEIERRRREIREGKVTLVSGEDVRQKLRALKPRER
jgi:hypothetical protein